MIELILLERKTTLIKGWLICFVIIFPFTFLPIITNDGSTWVNIVTRVPQSLLYTAAFDTILCLAAVYHNYQRVSIKLDYFKKPAFKDLNSKYIPTGKGSLVQDLGFYLLCKHQEFTYYLDLVIDLDDYSRRQLIIVPLSWGQETLDSETMLKEYQKLLEREFKVRLSNHQLVITLMPNEVNEEDPAAMTKTFTRIEAKLKLKFTGYLEHYSYGY